MVIMLLAAFYALVSGQILEKVTALVFTTAYIATPFSQNIADLWNIQFGILIIDLLVLMYLITISLGFGKYWPIWATSFHLIGTLTHLAILLDSHVRARAYISANIIFSYLVIAALVAGTALETKRRAPVA